MVGPSTIATAIARFSFTIGFDTMWSRRLYRCRISSQSVVSVDAASSWMAAIAAWTRYGPAVDVFSAPTSSCVPSVIAARFQSARS